MRIRLLREAGGMGDVVRCLGVARSIKHVEPSAEIGFYTLPGYRPLVDLCPDISFTKVVQFGERRARDSQPNPAVHRYLRGAGVWDATVDLYCPAFRYERDVKGLVEKDRFECWTESAVETTGLDLTPALPWLVLPEYTRGWAAGWLEARGLGHRRRPVVGIQPLSIAPSRCWTDEGWQGVVQALHGAGVDVVLFHSKRPEGARLGDLLGVPMALGHPLDRLAALVAACDLMVGIDSGLYHLAAAVRTPAVGIFALTNGDLLRRWYPSHSPVSAGPAEREGLLCDRPCYNFRELGYRKDPCRAGCAAIQRIPAARVAEEVFRRLPDGVIGLTSRGPDHRGPTASPDLRPARAPRQAASDAAPASRKSNNAVADPPFVRPC